MSYGTVLEVNTRVRVRALSEQLGRRISLASLPDEELDRWAELSSDFVWLLGVWTNGIVSREVARTHPVLRACYEEILPDLTDDDICGSCFAIKAYEVSPELGGDAALAQLRTRLAERGLRLMLDFVPNHTALDHPWAELHPDWYVQGTEVDLAKEPENWTRINGMILAHGRDPHFPGWTDTLQIDYSKQEVVDAMGRELLAVADRCDGVRCDVAMLLLSDVFERSWGRPALPFWPGAITQVRERHPGFEFLAEVYWGLEARLQQEGFDHCYDKGLYDLLRAVDPPGVLSHLRSGGLDYQGRLMRFLENHDEPRAGAAFEREQEKASAVVTYLSPGFRLLYQGQESGFRVRVPMQLCRGPEEPVDEKLAAFYSTLLPLLREPLFREGEWQLMECLPAWDGNDSVDRFVAMGWALGEERALAVSNLAPHASQCYVLLPPGWRPGEDLHFRDRLSEASYDRSGHVLYLDMPPWGTHVFAVTAR